MTKKPVILDPLSGVQSGRPGAISFVLGLPDPATFPTDMLRDAVSTVLQNNGDVALQYAPEQGYGRLIDYLIEKWQRDEGQTLTRSHVTLSFGSTDAVNTLSLLLTSPGDTVLVEAPSYRDTLHLFRDHGLRLVQIPTDGQGLKPEVLRVTLRRLRDEGICPRFLYTIPTFQNPSGVTLDHPRRQQIIALAKEYDFLIVADDVYRDLAYCSNIPSALGALDVEREKVITIGSFSKLLAAGLRLGWIIANPHIIAKIYDSGARAMGGGPNPLISHVVAHLCQTGYLERHIAHLRQVYRNRRDTMVAALDRFMPESVSWNRPEGGYFIWLTLPPHLSATKLVQAADAEGVTCLAGPAFYATEGGDSHIRLAFSYVPADKIEAGIAQLARTVKKYDAGHLA